MKIYSKTLTIANTVHIIAYFDQEMNKAPKFRQGSKYIPNSFWDNMQVSC